MSVTLLSAAPRGISVQRIHQWDLVDRNVEVSILWGVPQCVGVCSVAPTIPDPHLGSNIRAERHKNVGHWSQFSRIVGKSNFRCELPFASRRQRRHACHFSRGHSKTARNSSMRAQTGRVAQNTCVFAWAGSAVQFGSGAYQFSWDASTQESCTPLVIGTEALGWKIGKTGTETCR